MVVVLGHVDHGKTTLLDTIRKTSVVARESGGITQHVGAYVVSHGRNAVTFLDTPGHAAFSEMRKRGARVADVAILVVATDDGVKPQTQEAIEAIRAAGIPFVVALNKIDKSNADIDRAKTALTEAGVLLEGWGGDVPNVEISAKQGTGVDALLDLCSLVADMAELRADSAKPGEGVVIEAHRDATRGVVSTLLVKNGTLRVGGHVSVGPVTGKIKAMEDFAGKAIREAGPSTPAVVLGLNETPDVGDAFHVAENEAAAALAANAEASKRVFEQVIAEGTPDRELPVILKVDVVGSLEAIVGELRKLKNSAVALRILDADTGEITENDIKRASTLGALIVGFRVKLRPAIVVSAERNAVSVKTFDVIYELVDGVKDAVRERLPRNVIRDELGVAELLATFKKDPPRHVVGGRVSKGVLRKGALFELERGGVPAGRGEILETQEQKVAVDEIAQGREFGALLKFKSGGLAEPGDRLRVFTERIEEIKIG